jgi:hypothetical protein
MENRAILRIFLETMVASKANISFPPEINTPPLHYSTNALVSFRQSQFTLTMSKGRGFTR